MSSCSKPLKNKSKLKGNKIKSAAAGEKTGRGEGIGGGFQIDPEPIFLQTPSEIITKGRNNSFIVLGRDRPSHEMSGKGGKGGTHCGRVDLIAGLGSTFVHPDGKREVPDQQPISPSFATDAARVYISQDTHLDRHMGLAESTDEYGEGYSGIGLKADTIRVHSRGNIKIVTGPGKFQGIGRKGERFSNGCVNEIDGTISFITGNKTGTVRPARFNPLQPLQMFSAKQNVLQPLVKGENLVECLDDIISMLSRISTQLGSHERAIMNLALNTAFHTHVATSPGAPTLPSFKLAIEGPVQMAKSTLSNVERGLFNKNFQLMRKNYLEPGGAVRIVSQTVFTT